MKKSFAIIVLAASVIAFVMGVAWLFELRFEAGDVYPAYSSLRSDPLGTMAFLEGLQQVPGLSVQRDFNESNELPETARTAYLHLGGQIEEWKSIPDDLFHEIKGFLARGGRLVITFYPETRKPQPPPAPPPEKTDAKKAAPDKPDEKKPEPKANPTPNPDENADVTHSLKDFWGVDFGFSRLTDRDGTLAPAVVRRVADLPLPDVLDWHSAMIFTNVDEKWTTVYARGKDPVLIVRQFGPGSVVMAADSYFLSNEALSKDRHADLLAWLIGPNRQVVFDEAHFGIVEEPGIMALVRRYDLAGLVAGLFLLAALFFWKNFSSLVPPFTEDKATAYVAALDSTAGLVNLLRRNIPVRDLLKVSFEEWNKSATGTRLAARRAAMQTVLDAEKNLPPRQRNSVEAYRRIAFIVKPFSRPDHNPASPPASL